MQSDEGLLIQAKRRARRKLWFIVHATVYVLVNLLLVGINYYSYTSGQRYVWAVWPLLGWGLGLAIHGVVAFGVFDRVYQTLLAREIAKSEKHRS